MRYFLDTEFNGFCGDLIALALVPEDAALPPFYAALECPKPTLWVAEHILPVLNTELVSRDTLGHGLAAYLSNDPEPLLFADWPEDIAHAAMMLVAGPGRRYAIDRIKFELCDALGFDSAALSQVPHNALSDATALRAFILRREGR
ncbi:hypothetical protein IAG41_19675 [Sphingomonas sp. JC676]|uniref:hypothetical protein n=1 Tax=Sphingomonas sp. JC676 TaxID=2768065 RepID=UPI0016576D34|nr:hypothetical protein [Sphingomonas sp. JC676]MBC9034615.1 hypothetical protein [Sphingomonas sp. JC676]